MKRLLLTAILLVAAVIGCTAQKMKNVTVTNGNDFIKAIAPNTNITLKTTGILSITDALNKMPEDRNIDNVKWDDRSKLAPGVYYVNEYDGRSIIIVKIDNLTITGGGSEMTHIQATPTYAEVLTFSHCNNVTIKNIMAGHVETGDCSGDVIFFQNCKKVVMDKCDLYGCGVNGLWMDGSSDVTVNNTEIHDCSDDYIVIRDCENIVFNECIMRNSGGGLNVDENSTVDYQKCDILYNEEYTDYDDGYWSEDDIECPSDLMDAMNGAYEQFGKDINRSCCNSAIYIFLGEYEGQVVIPEDGNMYAAYIAQPLGDGEYNFFFLDVIDDSQGEKMTVGNGHIVVEKKSETFSYEIEENKLKSVSRIIKLGNGKTKYSHGKTKDSLKDCSKDVVTPHFEFDTTIIFDDTSQIHQVYPWG